MDDSGLPIVMSAQDIQKALQISKTKAYELLHSDNFPAFKIGKQYRVYRDKFLAWLDSLDITSEVA